MLVVLKGASIFVLSVLGHLGWRRRTALILFEVKFKRGALRRVALRRFESACLPLFLTGDSDTIFIRHQRPFREEYRPVTSRDGYQSGCLGGTLEHNDTAHAKAGGWRTCPFASIACDHPQDAKGRVGRFICWSLGLDKVVTLARACFQNDLSQSKTVATSIKFRKMRASFS